MDVVGKRCAFSARNRRAAVWEPCETPRKRPVREEIPRAVVKRAGNVRESRLLRGGEERGEGAAGSSVTDAMLDNEPWLYRKLDRTFASHK